MIFLEIVLLVSQKLQHLSKYYLCGYWKVTKMGKQVEGLVHTLNLF